jgi:hypothetical protein
MTKIFYFSCFHSRYLLINLHNSSHFSTCSVLLADNMQQSPQTDTDTDMEEFSQTDTDMEQSATQSEDTQK